jgi:hypothetical protein
MFRWICISTTTDRIIDGSIDQLIYQADLDWMIDGSSGFKKHGQLVRTLLILSYVFSLKLIDLIIFAFHFFRPDEITSNITDT